MSKIQIESNSQQRINTNITTIAVFTMSKIQIESNSQHSTGNAGATFGCVHYVKDTN